MKSIFRAIKKVTFYTSVVAFGAASVAVNATETLKWAHVYEPNTPFHQWALKAADEIKERTEGRYEVKVFPSASLGKEADLNESLGLGTIDFIFSSTGFAARAYKNIGVSSAPYVFSSYEHWKKYRDSDLFSQLAGEYDKITSNKLLAIGYYGQRHVTSNKSIVKPEDMKGIKIRVPNAPSYRLFPEAVGANATPLAFSEVYLALQQGAVDAQENPLLTIKSMKFNEVQKHINLTTHMTDSLITIASGITWGQIDEQGKEIIEDVIKQASYNISEDVRKQEMETRSWLEEQGNIVNEIDISTFRNEVLPYVIESMDEDERNVLASIQSMN